MTLDRLNTHKSYTFKGLTQEERILFMRLMYGEKTTTVRFVLDGVRSPALSMRYNRSYLGWRANHSSHTEDLSLLPFVRGGEKKQFKDTQFIIV